MPVHSSRLTAGVSLVALLAATGTAHATIITTGSAFRPINVAGNATESFMSIGPDGVGAMTVNGGSVLTYAPAGSDFGQLNIGGDQGVGRSGNGTVTVRGAGSRLDFTGDQSILQVGRIGNTSTGTLNVIEGGAIDMRQGFGLRIGRGNSNPGFGTDGATGTVLVDGAGSRISIGGADVTGIAPGLLLGRDQGTGRLTISNGGVVEIDTTSTGSGAAVTLGGRAPDASPIAASSGNGEIQVTGAGSRLTVGGNGAFIGVGIFGTSSVATFSVSNGGRAESVFFSIGRGQAGANGSTGTAIIDGAGSLVELSGRGVAGEAPGGIIGRDGGRGTLVIRNGGAMSIDSSAATQAGGGFTLGSDGGTGTLAIESGGRLDISGNALGGMGIVAGRGAGGSGTVEIRSGGTFRIETPTGAATSGSGITAGRDSGSAGTIRVDGGTLVVDARHDTISTPGGGIASRSGVFVGRGGIGVLDVANGGRVTISGGAAETTILQIGGNYSTDPASRVAGVGTVDVRGAGSRIDVGGERSRIFVGRWGDSSRGDLRISTGGEVTGNRLLVGAGESGADGSRGHVEISGIGSRLALSGVDSAGDGPIAVIGRDANGRGSLSITDEATMTIDPSGTTSTASRAGMAISGNATASGSVTLERAGRLEAGQFLGVGAVISAGVVSDTGTGSLTLRTGSRVRADEVHVGADGDVRVAASTLSADRIELRAGAPLVLDAGLVEARVLDAFAGASIAGTGTLDVGTVTLHAGATLAPGFSPGTIRVTGDLVLESGAKLMLDFVENPDGTISHDLIEVAGLLSSMAEIEILLAGTAQFADVVGRSLSMFMTDDTGTGLGGLYDGRTVTVRGDGGRTERYDIVGSVITATSAVDPGTPVPAPGSLALLLAAAGGLTLARRAR